MTKLCDNRYKYKIVFSFIRSIYGEKGRVWYLEWILEIRTEQDDFLYVQ